MLAQAPTHARQDTHARARTRTYDQHVDAHEQVCAAEIDYKE